MGYRSRAVFKLEEINNKIKFLDQKDNILDLGAAPGSWSQFLSKKNYKNILAIDILDIDKINYVEFVKGDFTDENIQSLIKKKFHTIDTILSDIAANTTGNKKLDSFNTNTICLEVLKFAIQNLKPKGNLLCKYFNGELDKDILEFSKKNFKKNKIIKPQSSRKDSKEMYIYCQK